MTPERWQRIKTALHEAMQLDPAPRLAYIDRISGGDAALRRELESLLSANERVRATFLEAPAIAAVPLEELPLRDPLLGRRLGPYQIVEEIGAGGMGEVYRAVRADDAYHQQVAIKLVRAGQGSSFVLARLRSERQILAALDHPNISRLLDGGTTAEGVPYLVMELIEGEPIHQYCDRHRLDTNARLRLFVQVCSAVHYAHQRLIIHRDIKPGNVLVTSQGTPKLLDFGIAKILEPRTLAVPTTATASVIRLFTPAYASPEQLKGEGITTASDVYSLGIVLYELLTGRNPQEMTSPGQSGFPKPSAAVRSGPPADAGRPRARAGNHALGRRLAGDLDNIVLMAIRREPERRYASAEQFATDIERHLGHLPVVARKDTLRYRAATFVARHTAAVTASLLVAVSLLGAVVVTLNEAHVARIERARAERRFDDARRLANSLMREIYGSIKDLPGATPARRLLVGKALEYLDGLSADALGDAALERELATAYSLVGDVQGNPFYANLGDPRGALASYRKALAIRERLAAAAPADPDAVRALSGSYNQVGSALSGQRDFAGALASYRDALRLLERVDAGSSDPKVLDQYAGACFYVAIAAQRVGDLDLAEASIRKAAAIRDAIVATDPVEARQIRTHSAGDHSGAAQILASKALYPSALDEQRKAAAIVTALATEDPDDATVQAFVAESVEQLGRLQEKAGQAGEALRSYRRSRQILEPMLAADPKNAFARSILADATTGIGTLEAQSGAIADALRDLHQALALIEPLGAADPHDPEVRATFANAYSGLGLAYEAQAAGRGEPAWRRSQDLQTACTWYRKSALTWSDLQRQGSLAAGEHDTPAAAGTALAKCEASAARAAHP